MVKYGKQFRQYQIQEWRPHYINYKALKQKIKQIKAKLPKEEQPSNTLFGVSNLNPMPLVPDNPDSTEDQNLAPLFSSKYGKYLKEFIDLLNEQFHKFYVFFSNTEKQLYQEINTHLYARENYYKFTKRQIKIEMNSLGVSIYLAKCLNCFINDNLTAVKKILKKFDKNFVNYFGLIAPRYILSQISSTSNDLDYIIQFKIIDEASCVCEESANILKELYLKLEDNQNNNNNINNEENNNAQEIQTDFMQQYKELLMCVREIDEIVDFKIQYKEWFSFIKKGNKLVKNNPTLLENDIFNPLLSSTNYKDSLIEKFLSTNKAFYEIEDVQVSVSDLNKRNMNLILMHKFFYNSLITCLIPTLFFFTNEDYKYTKPALSLLSTIIILAFSYITPYLSIYFFFKLSETKTMLLISYGLFFAGSFFHIISCNIFFNRGNNIPRVIYLIISRVFIGIGSMDLIGRKYIALYSPRFYLIKISKNYTKINFLGYAAGPFITLFLLLFPKGTNYNGYMHYNEFNCIGWYGIFMSIILFAIHFTFFTKQNSESFQMIRDEENLNFAIKTSFHSDRESRKEKTKKKIKKRKSIDEVVTRDDLLEGLIPIEVEDDKKEEKKDENQKNGEKKDELLTVKDIIEDKQKNEKLIDKEKQEEEKKEDKKEEKKQEEKNEEKKEEVKKEDKKEEKKEEKEEKKEEKEDEILNINSIEDEASKKTAPKKKKKLKDSELNEKFSQSANSLIRVNIGRPSDLSICSNNLDTGLNSSQILSTKQKKMINRIESKLDEYNEKSNFTNINMIPKSIDLLIEKEKNSFGYLKQNILVSFLILFFSNLLKKNIIVSFSYYLYKNEKASKKMICFELLIIYLVEIVSLIFVLPLKKINILIKKYLIIFMISTIIFISPLLYEPILGSQFLYFLIATGINLLCTIISILISCYLSYLLPPGWEVSFISAGKIPLCLISLGKVVGIIFSMMIVNERNNTYFIFILTVLSYGSLIAYLLITHNFRIKVISRIMKKRVYENMGI